MKRFVLMERTSIRSGAAKAAALAVLSGTALSCNWIPQEDPSADDTATLLFNFSRTKSGAEPVIDTNAFILSVVNSNTGEVSYDGAYGGRPDALTVAAGTYDVKVISRTFTAPEFDAPQYGDSSLVVASGGETMTVSFVCRQMNCGLSMTFTDTFKKKYGSGSLLLQQDSGSLTYSPDETRTAYLLPGLLKVSYDDGKTQSQIFSRTVEAGQMRRMTIDATNDEATSSFSITVDTGVENVEETIVVGEAADGLSMATAMTVSEVLAGSFKGDTLWVHGVIAGVITDDGAVDFECTDNTVDGNLVIVDSTGVTSSGQCLGIYLSKAALKTELALSTEEKRAALMGRRLYVQGKIDVYKEIPTVKNICDWKVE